MKRFLLAFAAVTALAPAASAQTNPPTITCYDAAARPNPVYVAGSTALRPFLAVVAQILAADSPAYTVVYQSQGSCTGVTAIQDPDPTKHVMKDIPAAGGKPANYAIIFKPDLSVQECSLDPAGNTVDVGVSDVFATSCGVAGPPANVTINDYFGPIQPMVFVVPSASTQRSISAEAAYLAFGLGGNGGAAAPWTDPTYFFVRNASSGTQQMISRAINVPAAKWWGVDRGSATNVRQQLKTLLDPGSAEKAIGIVSTDIADAERNNLRTLAFKGYGQRCGYLPDSTPTAKDKINVRDGHYPIWGPVHLLAKTTNGLPSPAAGALVTRFASFRLDKALLDAVITVGLVPACAMKVHRTEEMGTLTSYEPEFQCGCYYDSLANGASTCKACKGTADCPADRPACNFGYCEKK
jgi:ABC-type phosphate transport system substrate-binding protein